MEINPAGPDFEKKPSPKESGLIWAGPRPRMGLHGPAAPTAPSPKPAAGSAPAPGSAPDSPPASGKPPEQKPRKSRVRAVTSQETWLDRISLVDILQAVLFGGGAICFVVVMALNGGKATEHLGIAGPILFGAAVLAAIGILVRSGRNWAVMIQWAFTGLGLLSLGVFLWTLDMPLDEKSRQILLVGCLLNTAFAIIAVIFLFKAKKAPRNLLVTPGAKGAALAEASAIEAKAEGAPDEPEAIEEIPEAGSAEPDEAVAEEEIAEAEPDEDDALGSELEELDGLDPPDEDDLLGEIASLDSKVALGDGSLPAEEPEPEPEPEEDMEEELEEEREEDPEEEKEDPR